MLAAQQKGGCSGDLSKNEGLQGQLVSKVLAGRCCVRPSRLAGNQVFWEATWTEVGFGTSFLFLFFSARISQLSRFRTGQVWEETTLYCNLLLCHLV